MGPLGWSRVSIGLTSKTNRWDDPTMFLKLDGKRRLTIPAKRAATAPGDYFEARYDAAEDTISFRRLKRQATWLGVLKECPVAMEAIPARGRKFSRKARK
jgi:hypothetical protein